MTTDTLSSSAVTQSDSAGAIRRALAEQRYESARRLAEAALAVAGPAAQRELLWLLFEVRQHLGEMPAALAVLERLDGSPHTEKLRIALAKAQTLHKLSAYDFFRYAPERDAGYTGEEYELKYQQLSSVAFEAAKAAAGSVSARRQVAAVLRECRRQAQADALAALDPPVAIPSVGPARAAAKARGSLQGRLTFPDGRPVAGATVVLCHATEVESLPADCRCSDMDWRPKIGDLETQEARTDGEGRYAFADVPVGRQDFLAVQLDPAAYEISTRFVAQYFQVAPAAQGPTQLDAVVGEWTSAPAVAKSGGDAVFPAALTLPARKGEPAVRLSRIALEQWRNPFNFDFPLQPVELPLPAGAGNRLVVLCSEDPQRPQLFQITAGGRVAIRAALPARAERTWAIYQMTGAVEAAGVVARDGTAISMEPAADGRSAVVDTGAAKFRIAWGSRAADIMPPIMAVCGPSGRWSGQGRFVLPAGVRITEQNTEIIEHGLLLLQVRLAYTLSNGATWALELTFHRAARYVLARETSPALAGAHFEFSLRECVTSGGRGYLHWNPENGGYHWSDLRAEPRELARLEESVPWWIPPEGFGYAMTSGPAANQPLQPPQNADYFAVFTVRRGEWIDREFAKICRGPGENRELDWPFPEMVGSTISMITAHSDAAGDAFFRFGFFDGQRQWGLLVSDLASNDGPYKELAAVQHQHTAPRLADFRTWHFDEADQVERPFLVARRGQLRQLRAKCAGPAFAPFRKRLEYPKASGPAAGLRFILDGDPRVAWRRKLVLVHAAPVRARMTLLGRDYGDCYSPVGARAITPMAEDYDLLLASGVFTVDEERQFRAFLVLMGHLYMEPDFMNWQYGSRNCNFEADRTDVVGTVGMAVWGNPDARKFIDHTVALFEQSLEVYCTPGSGKWYENPACYYLHAAKCRANLACHLAEHGIYDVTKLPRFKEFLRWGILLLMPPTPHPYEHMRDGLTGEAYAAADKVRRLPPVGDHAKIGPWVPDHYGLLARFYQPHDPEFANELRWAWQAGGRDGSYYGNAAMVLAQLEEKDLEPTRPVTLASRRLEGFGAVLRGSFAAPEEFYLLLKQGPGGYRYHRTEGSFILFADGKPLVYDGGEAGETWRHSTLSFYDVHMPLAAGHVERLATLDSLEFVQGVHPLALKPGQAAWLSDGCEHQLVEEAKRRFVMDPPADSRCIWWIKDQYIIVHDELRLDAGTLTHWHLQVVADSHEGDTAGGYRFRGRFGTDLQVLLPGQEFHTAEIRQDPILEYDHSPQESFAMRHLQLSTVAPTSCLGILRPLGPGAALVQAVAIRQGDRIVGVRVTGENIEDVLYFNRHGVTLSDGEIAVAAPYAAVLTRHGAHGVERRLVLPGAGKLRWRDVSLESHGPALELRVSEATAELRIEGTGRYAVHTHKKSTQGQATGSQCVKL